MSIPWEVYLYDDGTLDTVLKVVVTKRDGTRHDELVRFSQESVERLENGDIPYEEFERLKEEALEEVEERIQAYNEEAQERRNGYYEN